MDIAQIRKLIKLIQSTDVTEIEISEGDHSVRISRQQSGAIIAATAPAPQVFAAAPAAAAAQTTGADSVEESSEHQVTSPMVGTFYRSPSPDSDPFVTEGSRVKKGDILCIIEAMKLMNEIEAEYNGVVERVLVENASPVEYGQALFVITPA